MESGWFIKNPMTKFYVIAGVVLFIMATLLAVVIANSLMSEKECTKIGCTGGINIEFVGLPESVPYEITIAYPSGETKTLKCSGAADDPQPYPEICWSNSAFISLPAGDPPDEITVTVKTGDGEWTETFQPDYTASNPNGEDCPAICYGTTILFRIPN